MTDEKLNLPLGYDAQAEPADAIERAPRGTGELVNGIRRLGKLSAQIAMLDDQRKKLQSQLMPRMRTPLLLLHPVTGKPVIAAAAQARPIKVDVGELRAALLEHGFDEEETETIVSDVLKDPEVDTKENGRFVQACERDGPLKIPLEVVAKVAKEKPSSAYIGFSELKRR